MFKNLIGDKAFYRRLLLLVIPIMVQNGITNFVNMLDNIMIGATSTAQMTGVAVTNQLIFVFNLCIFGAGDRAGAQRMLNRTLSQREEQLRPALLEFFGKKDVSGVHQTFRFKIIFGTLLTLLGIGIFVFGGEALIGLYMKA